MVVTDIVAFTESEINDKLVEEVLDNFQGHLDKSFFPKKIISIKKIPLTVSGKIDRKKLEEESKKHI